MGRGINSVIAAKVKQTLITVIFLAQFTEHDESATDDEGDLLKRTNMDRRGFLRLSIFMHHTHLGMHV